MLKLVAGVKARMDRLDDYVEGLSRHYLESDHLRDLRQVLNEPYWGVGRGRPGVARNHR